MLFYNCPKGRKGNQMKLSQAILDERVDDNTIVIIKDKFGEPIVCGRWYDNKIYYLGSYEVSFDFVEERNIAIFQML